MDRTRCAAGTGWLPIRATGPSWVTSLPTSSFPEATSWLSAIPDAPVTQRAAFAIKHLWVTPFQPDERFPSGDYPNQHVGGAGLPAWTKADREHRRRALVHPGQSPHHQTRGLAGHDGRPRRIHVEVDGVLRPQSGAQHGTEPIPALLRPRHQEEPGIDERSVQQPKAGEDEPQEHGSRLARNALSLAGNIGIALGSAEPTAPIALTLLDKSN